MTDQLAHATDPRLVLALPMGARDANAATIGEYLIELLAQLCRDGSGFNAKRPFGYSSWEFDLYVPLIRAGFVHGRLDGEGCVDEVDGTAADELIIAAVRSLWPERSADAAVFVEPGEGRGDE